MVSLVFGGGCGVYFGKRDIFFSFGDWKVLVFRGSFEVVFVVSDLLFLVKIVGNLVFFEFFLRARGSLF